MIKMTFYNRPTLLLGLLFFAFSAMAQGKVDFTISGKVTDNKNQSLVGATAQIAGTTLGTLSDVDGNYSFTGSLPAGSYRLTFSFVGYGTRYAPIEISATNNKLTMNAELSEDALNLSEVVVVGSTVRQEKKQLGNAMTSIRGDQLAKKGTGDMVQALQGKVAGAQITQNSGDPAGGISVKMRGAKSLLGSSEPLYVIDGVIVSNSTRNVTNVNAPSGDAVVGQNRLADINPNDIESIDVINGAAAAAIYGSRAANGVVLISTKRGTSGKPEISFSTSAQINQLRKKVPITTYGKQFGANATDLTRRLNTIADVDAATAGTQLAQTLVDVKRYDYQDDIFRQGMGTDNTLSVAGGSGDSKYYASVNYLLNQGILKNADFNRYAGKVRVDQKFNDWLTASLGVNYIKSFSNEKPTGNVFWSPINGVNITNNIYNINDRDAAGNLKAAEPTRINPLSAIETFDITQNTNRAITDLQITARPISGLSISYILGIDNINQTGRIYIPPYPYTGVNPAYFDKGYASTNVATTLLMNNDINIGYEKTFGNFSSTTTVGYSNQYSSEEFTRTEAQTIAGGITTVNGAATILNPGSGYDRFMINGYYLQETFGVNNRLFLTLAGRIDGSTSFAKENQNQFYPKASLSYLVSDEAFWKNTLGKYISQFKVRASYGEAGNLTGIGPYDRFTQFSNAAFLGFNALNQFDRAANANVKPERMKELEFGVDLSLFDRLSLGITYYKQDIKDLLIDRVLAGSTGNTAIRTNIGTMENKGIELSLNANVVRTQDLNWNLFGVFSRNRNKAIDIGQAQIAINNVAGSPSVIRAGAPVGIFYGFYFARNPDGSLLNAPVNIGNNVINQLPQRERGVQTTAFEGTPQRAADGQPTGAFLRKIVGDPNPDFIWSLGSNLTWKNFTFSFLLDAVYGNEVFNADKRTRQGVGIGDYAEKEYRGELPRGWINAIYPAEEWRIDDGSFVKIRELGLTYNVGALGKAMKNLQISLIGRNLYSFDDYNGYDPETNAGGQSSTLRGVDFGNVPIPRTLQLVLRGTF
jgi:TonB-linked SusC/RagA family outer membrane protein